MRVENPQPAMERDTGAGGYHLTWRGRVSFVPFGESPWLCPCGRRAGRWHLCDPCADALLGYVPPPYVEIRPTTLADRVSNWKRPTPDEHRLSVED